MDKSTAISILRSKGFSMRGYTSFSSENNSAGRRYWSNPNIACLQKEWNLILNDIDNHTLHLFVITPNSIKPGDLVLRADNNNLIDLQIEYGDSYYTDAKSNVQFAKWLKTSVVYDAADALSNRKNKIVISKWKGGNPGDVLTYDPPYDYEKCLLGISTDGRAVYDFYKAADYYVRKEGGSRVSEEEDYELRYEWQEMVDRDYSFFDDKKRKFPVFLEEGPGDYTIEDSKYDFSKCVIGHSFHLYNAIYSLNKMMDVVMSAENCSREEAKQICYSIGQAGSYREDEDNYNFLILDECTDDIPVTFGV